jgi:acyl-CoA oxidase
MGFCFTYPYQSYQLAEDLGRAFSDRAILQTFIDAEANVSAGSLKVSNVETILVFIYA